jgi:hypothetical protein
VIPSFPRRTQTRRQSLPGAVPQRRAPGEFSRRALRAVRLIQRTEPLACPKSTEKCAGRDTSALRDLDDARVLEPLLIEQLYRGLL